MKICLIWTDWGESEHRRKHNEYGGVGYYRIIKPAEVLRSLGHEVTVVGADLKAKFGETPEEIFPRIFEEHDLVISKHIDNPAAASALLAYSEHTKKPLLFDLDDAHYLVKPGTPAYKHYAPGTAKRAIVSASLSLASGLIVSTEPLKEAYLPDNQNITVIPNYNDLRDWNFYRTRFNDGKVRIGYMGSVTHNEDFELVVPALIEVLKKYPNAELELLGLMHKDTLTKFKKRFRAVKGKITIKYGTPSWKGYPELVSTLGWDIGIAPLTDDPFNRCKSHIKAMEYAMYEIPTVASKVYPYSEKINGVAPIIQGKTGYLCSSTEEWVEALSKLVEDKTLREEMGKAAYQYIKDNWQYEQSKKLWKQLLKKYENGLQ